MALTGREVANLMGVSRPRVQQLKKAGKLEAFTPEAVAKLKKERAEREKFKAERIQRDQEFRRELLAILRSLDTSIGRLVLIAGASELARSIKG